jgi:hypothetical protein
MKLPFLKRPVTLRLEDPKWPEQLAALRERLAFTPPQDPLWAGVIGLIDANIRAEMEPALSAGLSTEEAHRFRGRLGMLLDLKRELLRLAETAKPKLPG